MLTPSSPSFNAIELVLIAVERDLIDLTVLEIALYPLNAPNMASALVVITPKAFPVPVATPPKSSNAL